MFGKLLASLRQANPTPIDSLGISIMGYSNRLYVKCGSGLPFEEVQRRFPSALLEPPSEFACIPVPLDERMPAVEIDRVSRELNTEVIYLAFSSATDSLQFTRSIAGRPIRHLQYGINVEQGLWEEVAGSPEEWEHAAFFSDDLFADLSPDDPDYDRAMEIYKTRTLVAGEIYPIIDARESARAAAIQYQLTDWLDDWQDMDDQDAVVAEPEFRQLSQSPRKVKPWWRFW